MVASAAAALDTIQEHIQPLEQQLDTVSQNLERLEKAIDDVRTELTEIELKGLELNRAIRQQRHELNELRHKVKKHGKLLAEIEPQSAPREYRRISEERDHFEMQIVQAVRRLEELREQYDDLVDKETTLFGREWELEQEYRELKERYDILLRQISRLAQALERKVRDIRAKYYG